MEADQPKPAETLPVNTREMVEKSLSHPNVIVRAKAVEAAGRLNTPAVLPLLQPLLADTDARVKAAVIEAIARNVATDSHAAIEAVCAAATAPERVAFVQALGRRADSVTEGILARLLTSDTAPPVRAAAVRVLRTAARPETIRAVIEAAVDFEEVVRSAVDLVLQENAARWFHSPAACDALPKLDAARAYPNAEVQRAAARWCERIRTAQVRRTMLESGIAPVMALTTALRSEHNVLRHAAAAACVQLGDKRAVPALVDSLRDADADVRRSVAVALSALKWEAESEEHYAAYLLALGRWKQAAAHGAAAVDALSHAARINDPAQQILAAEALGATQSTRAMKPLAEMLESPYPQVRAAAARTLKSLEWVPPTEGHAVAQAMALEDWAGAGAHGAIAVPRLLATLKSSRGNPDQANAITDVLLGLQDANAAEHLVAACRDGEVAGTAVSALEQLLLRCAPRVAPQALAMLSGLNDVMQFKFVFDPAYGTHVRAGFDLVNLSRLRSLAADELARRTKAARPDQATEVRGE
jgi:HEAT repeat protein